MLQPLRQSKEALRKSKLIAQSQMLPNSSKQPLEIAMSMICQLYYSFKNLQKKNKRTSLSKRAKRAK